MASASDSTSWKRKAGTLPLLIAFALAAGLASCDDGPTGSGDDLGEDATLVFPSLSVSNPVGAAAGTGTLAAANAGVTYISASPGTFSFVREITITNLANGMSETVSVEAEGFDPVAIEAAPGDTLDFLVRHTDGSTSEYFTIVPARKRPRVVRTMPQKGATDVVLSTTIVVVFSEPIDKNSATAETVQLRLDGAPVDGALELSADGMRASFTPAAPLQPATTYTLVITTNLLDLQGDSLEEEVLATFTTAGGLAAGAVHTCVVRADGATYCWGDNRYGQLARPASDWELPGPMSTELEFESLSLGWYHSCGVTSDLEGYCWGHGRSGKLGNGQTPDSDRDRPVAVAGGHSFVSLTAAANHTCGLTAGGAAYCWGGNRYGQLGNGTTADRRIPVQVYGGHAFVSLTTGCGGYHTCGLTVSGAAYCWGLNIDGQLGAQSWQTCEDEDPCSTVPLLVSGPDFVSLAPGHMHTCGLTASGDAYCWGGNYCGELGIGVIGGEYYTPQAVEGGHSYTIIAAGRNHTCGLTTDGQAYCWGFADLGQLGIGPMAGDIPTPTPVVGGYEFRVLVAGLDYACGRTPGGQLYCWGDNTYGQLGHDPSSLPMSWSPLLVPLP
ncbi:MAG: Ig-like domain-containing protein [Gemmatimonadales bacterium]